MASRVAAPDDGRLAAELDARGFTVLPALLDDGACDALAGLYPVDAAFRSRVVMARHGFGRGEYSYFRYPLPELVATLRGALYARLAPVANQWRAAMGGDERYPATLAAYLRRCHDAGQRRPTPLLLRYATGDYNCLHQDVYGAEVFPLQVAILLSAPGRDFSGGELVLSEQRPRRQSRVHVVPLGKGDAVAFAVRERPVRGSRGFHRVTLRHGVSELRSGARTTLGILFHDAA
jgi:hypothetical protein